MVTRWLPIALLIVPTLPPLPFATAAADPPNPQPAKAVFDPKLRAVSTWREEAAGHLVLTPIQVATLRALGPPPSVARCVKLNNYWCIKRAGWDGELAADGDGHVAFATAVEGTAVAALLLRRYYVDFHRKSAFAIVSHWAPAECGRSPIADRRPASPLAAPRGLRQTLRARWLATHSRGFVTPIAGRGAMVKRSVIADHAPRMMQTPTIAVGLGEISKPMTLDALMMASPNAPRSRSMIGLPRGNGTRIRQLAGLSGCSGDAGRIAGYAAKAAAGIDTGPDGDLNLFGADGSPTANLKIMMTNMARVEIGPLGPTPAVIEDGIAAAFRAGRNPPSRP